MSVLEGVLTHSLILQIWVPKNLSNKNEVSGRYHRIYLRKTYFFARPPLVIAVHPAASLWVRVALRCLFGFFKKRKQKITITCGYVGNPTGCPRAVGNPTGCPWAGISIGGPADKKRHNVMGGIGIKDVLERHQIFPKPGRG